MKFFSIFLLLIFASLSYADTYFVPDSFATIQGAVDSVSAGDTIIIRDGVYSESIVVEKNIVLASEFLLDNDYQHIENTIITSSEEITLFLKDTTIINGLSFKNSLSAITIAYTKSDISNCIFANNYGYESGISILFSSVFFTNVLFYDNTGTEGGLFCDHSKLTFLNCTYYHKDQGVVLGLQQSEDEYITIINSIFYTEYPENYMNLIPNHTNTINIAYNCFNWKEFHFETSENSFIEGNIFGDPFLNNDLTLSDSSNCLDSGIDSILIDSVWYYAPLKDIYGNDRPNPTDNNPDMGAFESDFYEIPNNIINNEILPTKFVVYPNYPNPFNPTTIIRFFIPKISDVKLVVYDIQGKVVDTLIDEKLSTGNYLIHFDGTNLTSGTYFYVLNSNSGQYVGKMMLIK